MIISLFNEMWSIRWAAYIAGTILVLMTELGVQFDDSICILVMHKSMHFINITRNLSKKLF